MATLNDLRDAAHAQARKSGWYDGPGGDRNIGEQLMLVVTEIAEAMEEVRTTPTDQLSAIRYELPGGVRAVAGEFGKPVGFPIEIADALIRLFDLCGYLGIDIDEAVRVKHLYNGSRPYKHGKRA